MMNHRGYAQQGAAPSGHFVGFGYADNYTGSATISLSGSVLSGDVAIALSTSVSGADQLATLLLGGPGGSGYANRFSRQVLGPTEQANQSIATTGTGSSCTTLVGVYRGPSTATLPTFGFNDNTTSSPVVCPGFTKNAGALAIAYMISSPFTQTFSANPGVLRAVTADGRVGLADFDPASLYTNGTPESWAYLSLANVSIGVIDLH